MKKERYLECGRIVTTHGVRGEVRAESYCDSPEVLAGLSRVYLRDGAGNYEERRVLSSAPHKGQVRLLLAGVPDMNAAICLRGRTLYAAREDIPLPEGGAFIADMIGLPVFDADSGVRYGTLSDVQPSPAAQLYTVTTPAGRQVLLPAVPAFVRRVDTESGVYITPIEGFFEPGDILPADGAGGTPPDGN